MTVYLVTFKDKGNCEILQVTTSCLKFDGAISSALTGLRPEVYIEVVKDTDSVLVECLE